LPEDEPPAGDYARQLALLATAAYGVAATSVPDLDVSVAPPAGWVEFMVHYEAAQASVGVVLADVIGGWLGTTQGKVVALVTDAASCLAQETRDTAYQDVDEALCEAKAIVRALAEAEWLSDVQALETLTASAQQQAGDVAPEVLALPDTVAQVRDDAILVWSPLVAAAVEDGSMVTLGGVLAAGDWPVPDNGPWLRLGAVLASGSTAADLSGDAIAADFELDVDQQNALSGGDANLAVMKLLCALNSYLAETWALVTAESSSITSTWHAVCDTLSQLESDIGVGNTQAARADCAQALAALAGTSLDLATNPALIVPRMDAVTVAHELSLQTSTPVSQWGAGG
jgi:hypothetical protein